MSKSYDQQEQEERRAARRRVMRSWQMKFFLCILALNLVLIPCLWFFTRPEAANTDDPKTQTEMATERN